MCTVLIERNSIRPGIAVGIEQKAPRLCVIIFPAIGQDTFVAIQFKSFRIGVFPATTPTVYYDWNGPAAQNEFQRTFDVNPNYAMAHSWNSESLAAMGRFPEALVEARRAVEEDPLSLIVNSNAGWTFCLAGQYEEAIQTLSRAIDIDPSFPRTHFRLGNVYETRGLYDKAITEFTQAVQLSGGDVYYTAGLGHAYAMAGRTSDAQQILISLLHRSAHQYVPAFALAIVYAGLKEDKQALCWLERTSADHSTSMTYVKVDPTLNELRSDPRFAELLQRVKF